MIPPTGRYYEEDHEHYERPRRRTRPRTKERPTYDEAVDGVVVTYQQVASAPDLFAHHLARSTFVVHDEVHHAGEQATWGTALRAAFDGAGRRLSLSGRPCQVRRRILDGRAAAHRICLRRAGIHQ